ncbi:Hypothetical predicted protein [Pelobates cultripes]|uniref:Uncharacterized protein n=1 Tax=Pelobates cultripes TaxID=61616 RepID=A0AAD1WHW7_PELCU|nr:Hypothetical predicted protein [Pelobates cultripes]
MPFLFEVRDRDPNVRYPQRHLSTNRPHRIGQSHHAAQSSEQSTKIQVNLRHQGNIKRLKHPSEHPRRSRHKRIPFLFENRAVTLRRSQRPPQAGGRDTQDIGGMLQRPRARALTSPYRRGGTEWGRIRTIHRSSSYGDTGQPNTLTPATKKKHSRPSYGNEKNACSGSQSH